MNERIKELSNIAYMNHVERNPHSSFGRRYDYDKEFAELIVRECISTLEEKIHRSIDNEGDEIWADLILKEHFGVEE
jgi:hypothetical protein